MKSALSTPSNPPPVPASEPYRIRKWKALAGEQGHPAGLSARLGGVWVEAREQLCWASHRPSPKTRPTSLRPGDRLLAGVHVIFKHRLQDCGSLLDFLGADGLGFLGGGAEGLKERQIRVGNNEAVYNRFNNSKITQ